MAIYDLFFKRKKRECGEYPDVYQYDDLPYKLRVQIIHLWRETLSQGAVYSPEDLCKRVHMILCKELGVFKLLKDETYYDEHFKIISNFFIQEFDFNIAMSVIELMSYHLYDYLNPYQLSGNDLFEHYETELNYRFREHGLGYELCDLQLIKINSQLIHKDVILPTLNFLAQKTYKGANEEFLKAHEHYRYQRYSECLNECLKAYESTLKIICTKRGWEFDEKSTLNQLVKIILDKGLCPSFWENNLTHLNGLLTSSINVGRNKLSGHGQGTKSVEIPEYLVAYMLHMTASTILFLVKADESID